VVVEFVQSTEPTGVSTSTRSDPSLIVGTPADMVGGVVQTQRLALSLLRSASA
jgi:hypothetical protein